MIVTEWLDLNLSQLIHDMTSPYDVKYIMREVIGQMNILHSNNIIHRDVKPSNIMLKNLGSGSNLVVKIVDFGMAIEDQFDEGTLINEVGSLYYRAP